MMNVAIYINLILTVFIVIAQSVFLSWLFFNKSISTNIKIVLGFSPLLTFFSAIIIAYYYILVVFLDFHAVPLVGNILQLGLLLLLFAVVSSMLSAIEHVKVLSNVLTSGDGSN